MTKYFAFVIVLNFLSSSFVHNLRAGSPAFEVPKNEDELKPFFDRLAEGKLKLSGIEGRYALPKNIQINGISINSIKIKDGVVRLVDSGSSPREFILIKPIASLDKMLSAPSLGALFSTFSTTNGADPWTLLPENAIIGKNTTTSEAMLMPLQVCYLNGHTMFFGSIKKSVGENGPV